MVGRYMPFMYPFEYHVHTPNMCRCMPCMYVSEYHVHTPNMCRYMPCMYLFEYHVHTPNQKICCYLCVHICICVYVKNTHNHEFIYACVYI
jgi:hypothetical protein